MKTKLLATIVTLILLLGSISFAINIVPKAISVDYRYLTIATNPSSIGVVTVPAVGGPHQYPYDSIENCTAPLEKIVGDTKYVFDKWTVSVSDGEWNAAPGQIWVYMKNNKTATAVYKVYYKFTVTYPWNSGWIEQFVPAIWQEGAGPVLGTGANGTYWAWIEQYKKVQAGLRRSDGGIWRGTPYVYGKNWNEIVSFVNWTGLGYYIQPDGNAWSTSCKINMTGPKSASAAPKFVYPLYVKASTSTPPGPGPTPPPGQNWYDYCTYVTLTALETPSDPGWVVPGWARWVFDTWKLDGVVPAGQPNLNLTVHMDMNHTAEVFYKYQSWITLRDDIGNQSGIWDNGKWYDYCKSYTFTAKPNVQLDSTHMYDFKYWVHSTFGIIGYTESITFHVNTTSNGAILKAVYHMQYKLHLFSSPAGVPDEPLFLYSDSDKSCWKDAGSTINLKAKPTIMIGTKSKWVFVQWKNHLGGTDPSNNATPFTMLQPWNITAEYDLYHFAEWDYSPTSISLGLGWPGSGWVKNGTLVSYTALATDLSGKFVFYYWVIDSGAGPVTYAQGVNPVPLGQMTCPIDGTAYYANKTKIFMDPSYHEETAHAYCNKFNVTIYATNFDANRLVGGQPMDIYGFDINVKFNPTLLEVQKVFKNVNGFFGNPPNGTFTSYEEIDNVNGHYELSAAVKGNYTGFVGTRAIFTLEFHVIYDPCFPNEKECWIEFDPAQRELANHLGNPISPELFWNDCKYKIKTVKPMLDIRDHLDGDNLVFVHKNAPQPTFFDVDVWLLNGVKVHDFYIVVQYNTTQISAVSVVIGTYLKPSFTAYSWWLSADKVYVWVAQGPTVPLQNCSGILFTIKFKVIKTIYYTMPGPDHLTSNIVINSGYISVKCPDPWNQEYPTNLGQKQLQYVYNPLPGDLNYDGKVTVADLQLIADNYHKIPVKYDITGDGETDLFDLVFVALRFGDTI